MAARENSPIGHTIEQDLTITRILNAPREMVFRAFSDPEQVKQWWGPKGFTRLTIIHHGSPPGQDRESARQGWNESLDKLSEYLLAENLADEEEE